MMTISEIYFKGLINLSLMVLPWYLESINPTLRVLSVLMGIVLTFFLIRRVAHEITGKKLDNELKKLEIEKKNQEIAEIILKNKK